MIYLSGCVQPTNGKFGLMLTPMMGNQPDLRDVPWAADTGCYAQPDRFRLAEYLTWLSARPKETCLFATAPDVVQDWEATLEKSLPVLPMIRDCGFPAALVVQDGAIDLPWNQLDCLFVGGSTEWKLSEAAYGLVTEAKSRGKWTHMGRVNSWKRFRAAAVSGYDSADGTFLKHGPDVLRPRLEAWLDRLNQQPVLEGV